MVKQDVKSGAVPWTKESVIELYDSVAEEVNNSQSFMMKATNVPVKMVRPSKVVGKWLKSKGLFIQRKDMRH